MHAQPKESGIGMATARRLAAEKYVCCVAVVIINYCIVSV